MHILKCKEKAGRCISRAFVPYGYEKSNDKDKHKLEIDVYAADVVKDIFQHEACMEKVRMQLHVNLIHQEYFHRLSIKQAQEAIIRHALRQKKSRSGLQSW